jgi:hypothetical protein
MNSWDDPKVLLTNNSNHSKQLHIVLPSLEQNHISPIRELRLLEKDIVSEGEQAFVHLRD